MLKKNDLDLVCIDPPATYDGVLLGLDFGTKRIGVAIGQTLTKQARPLTILAAQEGVPSWPELAKLLKQWQPLALIVGIPLNMDDTAQPMTHRARHFALTLKQHFHLPVHGIDERLTSRTVRADLFEQGGYRQIVKQGVDALAAKLMLEEWMSNN